MPDINADVIRLWTTKAAFPTLAPGAKYKMMAYDPTLKLLMMKAQATDTIASEWSDDTLTALLARIQTFTAAQTFSSGITVNGGMSVAGIDYPLLDGTSGQAIVTDGAGNLSFATVTTPPSGPAGSIQFTNGTTFDSDPQLLWNDTTKRLGIGGAPLFEALDITSGGLVLRAATSGVPLTGMVLGYNAFDGTIYSYRAGGPTSGIKFGTTDALGVTDVRVIFSGDGSTSFNVTEEDNAYFTWYDKDNFNVLWDASNGKAIFNASQSTTADFQWNHGTGVGLLARASDGFVGINTNSPVTEFTVNGQLTVRDNDMFGYHADLDYYNGNENEFHIRFRRSDSSTIGALSETFAGTDLGGLQFWGVDTSNNRALSAKIEVAQEGDATATRAPGILRLYTYGLTGSNTDQLVLGSNGDVSFNLGKTLFQNNGKTTFNALSNATSDLQWNWDTGVGALFNAVNGNITLGNTTAFFDYAQKRVGIGNALPQGPLDVTGAEAIVTERTTVASTGLIVLSRQKATTTADMTDGFGVTTEFRVQDSSLTPFTVGRLNFSRTGGSDVLSEFALRLNHASNTVLTIGTGGLATFNPESNATANLQWNWDTGVGIFARASDGYIGIGTSSPDSSLHVSTPNQPVNIQRNHDALSTVTDPLVIIHKTSLASTATGFGTMLRFATEASTGGYKIVGRMGFIQGTVDTEGKFSLRTGTGGNEEFFTIGENSLTTLNVARLSTGGLELLKQSSGSVISANASNGYIGFGIDHSLAEGAYHFKNISSIVMERTGNGVSNVAIGFDGLHSTTGDMVAGFGTGFRFGIRDSANVYNVIGAFYARRGTLDNEGTISILAGTNGNEEVVNIGETGVFSVTLGNLDISATGKGLGIKGGAVTDSIGNAVLVAGTVTIANTNILATDKIMLSVRTAGGTQGFLSTTIVAATSFTINSTSVLDTSTVTYQIIRTL